MTRPSHILRLLLALLVVAAVLFIASSLLSLADTTLSVWQRLEQLPALLRWLFIAALGATAAGGGWLLWKLLKPGKQRTPQPVPIDRGMIEQRVEALAGHADAARQELDELDRRRQSGVLYLTLFGRISSGKTSLMASLAGDAATDLPIAVTGGSTRRVHHVEGETADGRRLVLADVPGTEESDDQLHTDMARAEAARAHALLYVCDGELSRSEDNELRAISAYGKPVLLVINKSDRYNDDELKAITERLRQRYADQVRAVVAVSAGGMHAMIRRHADGTEHSVERQRPPRIGDLLDAIQHITSQPLEKLEPARESAVLAAVDHKLDQVERDQRLQRSEAAIKRYTQRAMIGAMAAIAPGSDLVIQGALATALARELASIHQLPLREVDVDDFLTRAGGLLRTSTSVVLAVAGNALKAFPGMGTLSGGLLHAVAYGLIFHSLGHALADSFSELQRLDREATLDAFQQGLRNPQRGSLMQVARIARDILQEPESK